MGDDGGTADHLAGSTWASLSEREQVVLGRLATDQSLGQLARSLFVSRNTVKSQVRSLYAKLGVHSRDEAIARARDLGLL